MAHPSIYKSSPTRQENPVFPFCSHQYCRAFQVWYNSTKISRPPWWSKAGPLAVKLAREAFFGEEVLAQCTAQSVASDSSQPYHLKNSTSWSRLCLHDTPSSGVTLLSSSLCGHCVVMPLIKPLIKPVSMHVLTFRKKSWYFCTLTPTHQFY